MKVCRLPAANLSQLNSRTNHIASSHCVRRVANSLIEYKPLICPAAACQSIQHNASAALSADLVGPGREPGRGPSGNTDSNSFPTDADSYLELGREIWQLVIQPCQQPKLIPHALLPHYCWQLPPAEHFGFIVEHLLLCNRKSGTGSDRSQSPSETISHHYVKRVKTVGK